MKIYLLAIQLRLRKIRAILRKRGNQEFSLLHLLLHVTAAFAALIFILTPAHAVLKQKGFASPEEAVAAFVSAMKVDNKKELLAIFGPAAKELISSGDEVRDREGRRRFIEAYTVKNSLVQEGEKRVLTVGQENWPFPIPLAKKGDRWFFDTEAGKEEILNRRIGENELSTIQTLLAIVDAQREYAIKFHQYAEKFESDPGKKNGLFWETKKGEEPSPLGELVAHAQAKGYVRGGAKDKPMPYHGYHFRMLKKQGKHASDGAYDYVVKGRQMGGFAVIAYPATYGNSGVMTFMVNHDGVIFEKDLGKDTAKTAKSMKAFDPDESWKKEE